MPSYLPTGPVAVYIELSICGFGAVLLSYLNNRTVRLKLFGVYKAGYYRNCTEILRINLFTN